MPPHELPDGTVPPVRGQVWWQWWRTPVISRPSECWRELNGASCQQLVSDDDELGEDEGVGEQSELVGWKWRCCSVQRDDLGGLICDSQLPGNIQNVTHRWKRVMWAQFCGFTSAFTETSNAQARISMDTELWPDHTCGCTMLIAVGAQCTQSHFIWTQLLVILAWLWWGSTWPTEKYQISPCFSSLKYVGLHESGRLSPCSCSCHRNR